MVSLTSPNIVKNGACIGVNQTFQRNNNEKQHLPASGCFLITLQTLSLPFFGVLGPITQENTDI
jgi:hypothetical protein